MKLGASSVNCTYISVSLTLTNYKENNNNITVGSSTDSPVKS